MVLLHSIGKVKVGLKNFKSVLYLDDMRVPQILGIDHVRNYAQFVWYIQNKSMPEVLSFDHDLHIEHYPFFEEETPGRIIPYEKYREKTGLECARYLIENKLPVKHWFVHSANPVGANNIRQELRAYCPEGELRGLQIPFRIDHSAYGRLLDHGYRV